MKNTLTPLPVDLTLFDGGDGNAGPAGSSPTAGSSPGSGPTTTAGSSPGSGPTTTAGSSPGSGPTTTATIGAEARDGTVGPICGGGPTTGGGDLPPAPGPIPAQARREAQFRAWDSQAQQARAVYPGFDLGREAQSRDFRSLLRAGVSVRRAFEVVHLDELRAAQAKATERAVTANILAKGTRPQENGAGASSAFTVKDSVSRLTPKDRAEMARRAARGEVITF